MSKLPIFPCYPGDWFKDPALSKCRAATRGIWADLLMRMHENNRSGKIVCTAEQGTQLARCSAEEFIAAAQDLEATETAHVTVSHENVTPVFTIINRRMYREWKERKSASERQKRKRSPKSNVENSTDVTVSHGNVTPKSRSLLSFSSSISSSLESPLPKPAKQKTPAPEKLPIGDELKNWAAANEILLDLSGEAEIFLEHHRGKASRFADWTAAFRVWLLRAKLQGWDQPKAFACAGKDADLYVGSSRDSPIKSEETAEQYLARLREKSPEYAEAFERQLAMAIGGK